MNQTEMERRLSLYITAAIMLENGFCVIPLVGKRCTVEWTQFQFERPSLQLLREWFQTQKLQNIGIVCGEVSSIPGYSLAVMDLDGEKAVTTFQEKFPHLLDTYTVITGSRQGAHLYYWCATCPPTTRTKGIELRSNGSYVVAPPSIHPDTGYEYVVGKELEILKVDNLDDVVRWIRSLTPSTPPTNDAPQVAWARMNPRVIAAIAGVLLAKHYRQKGRWLFGHCPFTERHQNGDLHPSFGFDTLTGRAHCFAKCSPDKRGTGFIKTLDLCARLGIDVNIYGGLFA